MKQIILEANHTDAIVFDIAGLMTHLEQLDDSRHKRGKIYPLTMILVMIILAKLAGEDKPSAIADWIRCRKHEFIALFNCKHQRMPCLNTLRWVLQQVVSIEKLEKAFKNYLHQEYGGQESQLISIDGKTMRGTIPKGCREGVHLMAAYLPEEGVVLKQVEVKGKENEIKAAPQLLEGLNLKNKVVCGDAMQCQRQLSVTIKGQGGNYLWFLKENQPTLLGDVKRFFEPPQQASGWPLPTLPQTVSETINLGHGRLEKRTLTLIMDKENFLDWPGICQVFRLERSRQKKGSEQKTIEVVYGITSCTPDEASAEQLLYWTRAYWGIENGLHYRRDVTLREDATRIKHPVLARAIATINNFIVSLVRKLGYPNLAAARRVFNARIDAQLL